MKNYIIHGNILLIRHVDVEEHDKIKKMETQLCWDKGFMVKWWMLYVQVMNN